MIQWYPGHMAKAKKEIEEKLKLVDIVFELVDARIPYSSKNPLISTIVNNKPKLMLLTKSDMADKSLNHLWAKHYEKSGYIVLEIDSISGLNIKKIVKVSSEALKEKLDRERSKGLKPRPIRAMIVGIPNVGKSTLLNKLVNKRVATVGNKPGVTKAQQWVRINDHLSLLDTPGVLWPKFEDQKVGMHLAVTGAIRDEVLRIEEIGEYLLNFLKEYYPSLLINRYNIDINLSNLEIIKKISQDRGILGDDYSERVYDTIINELRNVRIGKVTLDRLN